jgi:uncharacterized RDD family membrane protein YckC
MVDSNNYMGTRSGSRLSAAMIDTFIAIIFSLICAYTFTKIFNLESTLIFLIGISSFYLLYFFIMESIWSRTLGKMITGLEIKNKKGGKISTNQALIRTILRVIETNPIIGFIIAQLLIIFTKRRQRLGDILADTVVNFKYD